MKIEIFSSCEGILYLCNARLGQKIITDQVLFVVKQGDKKQLIYSPVDGILTQLEVSQGDHIVHNMLLASILTD